MILTDNRYVVFHKQSDRSVCICQHVVCFTQRHFGGVGSIYLQNSVANFEPAVPTHLEQRCC